ncbi:MAG: DNA polymerase III subunit gamma/tau [Acidimicrobiia bacterium]|nr:DNA polymerase III subunit gamma/tau [Acidimicrobiia bacterium]
MSYQVIARKWRPQRFDDLVGQQAVTRTLCNALTSGRLAQAFVFAGPRGIGKTTTARILAKALNCEKGPTSDPCGRCDACVEIAEGRDIDVLEIDAATHTGVDNVREVIIAGLGIMPVRDRYKVFIIDEVHQLSTPSFNALLKSIEEPPPHVVFIMATTELEKIPETVLSRSQVYEFRMISTKAIADQLKRIADAERIDVGFESLLLIARDADGSMRDAQSKLDQVLAFTGTRVGPDDVSAVLGLVGRDLLLDIMQAVADEQPAAAFTLAGRAVELGYDLRLVCRELARVTRDLVVLSVDPSRAQDPEIAGDAERDRLIELSSRFSREDLLRAFDLLSKAETDIRASVQPRYHLEMALLRWIYVRKLTPIEDLIASAIGVGVAPMPRTLSSVPGRAPVASPAPASRPQARTAAPPSSAAISSTTTPNAAAPSVGASRSSTPGPAASDATFKDAWLAEVRKGKTVFYSTVVAQAQRIDISPAGITFTFTDRQRALRDMFEQNRAWLETLAQSVGGRRLTVTSAFGESPVPPADIPEASQENRKAALKERAMSDPAVQALLEVFPADISDVEEM